MNLENLKMIAGAASIAGPAGTTGYLIATERMVELRRDLNTPKKAPTAKQLLKKFANTTSMGSAEELAGLIAEGLHELDANDELDDDYRALVQRTAQIFSGIAGEKKSYTVFCREANDDLSTTHIATHEARTLEEAKRLGKIQCADDRGCEDVDSIEVIGVATVVNGCIEILHWDERN